MDYSNYFSQSVLTRLPRWQECLHVYRDEVATLLEKRSQIVQTIRYALALPSAWPMVVELMNQLATYMERWGFWGEWAQLLEMALTVSRNQQDLASEVKLLVLRARLAQRQSDSPLVISSYRRVIRLARQMGDEENEARACSNLAYLYTEAGYAWRAEILGCHALAIFNELNYPHGLAHTHNHLGLLYTRLRQWDLAQTHLTQACMIWQEMGDRHGVMQGELNLGLMYNDKTEPITALSHLEQALEQANYLKEQVGIATIFTSIGVSHRLNNAWAEGKAYFWQAESILRPTGNRLRLAHVQTNLALVYAGQQQWATAKPYFQTALELYQQLKHHHYEIATLLYLVKFELDQAHDDRARGYLETAQLWLAPRLNNPFYSHLATLADQYRHELYGARV